MVLSTLLNLLSQEMPRDLGLLCLGVSNVSQVIQKGEGQEQGSHLKNGFALPSLYESLYFHKQKVLCHNVPLVPLTHQKVGL